MQQKGHWTAYKIYISFSFDANMLKDYGLDIIIQRECTILSLSVPNLPFLNFEGPHIKKLIWRHCKLIA